MKTFPSNNIIYNYYSNNVYYNKNNENDKLKHYAFQILNPSNYHYSYRNNPNINNNFSNYSQHLYSNSYNLGQNNYINNNNFNNISQINNSDIYYKNFNNNTYYNNSYINNNNNINQNNKNFTVYKTNNNNIKDSIEKNSYNEIWSLFPKFFLFLEYNKFNKILRELVSTQKNFFLFMYGTNDSNGNSWCLDCDNAKPFINKAKNIVSSREKEKEIYFVSVPIDRDKKIEYKKHPICQMKHVPTLAYFEKGKEINRILEREMSSQEFINNFIEMAYKIK